MTHTKEQIQAAIDELKSAHIDFPQPRTQTTKERSGT